MRVLVTGAGGFIGSNLASILAADGFDVAATYRQKYGPYIAALWSAPSRNPVKLIQCDLVDDELPGPFDAIVHAASVGPWSDPDDIARNNIEATRSLIRTALRWRTRKFFFCSSISVYGKISVPVVDEETEIVDPDAYGRSKLAGEEMLWQSAEDMPALALRLPGVIGPNARLTNWLPKIADDIKAGRPVRAFNLGAPFNNAAHVADIGEFISKNLRQRLFGFDAVVLGAMGTITVESAIQRLATAMDKTAEIEEIPPPYSSFTLSSDKAIGKYGYNPMRIDKMIYRFGKEPKIKINFLYRYNTDDE